MATVSNIVLANNAYSCLSSRTRNPISSLGQMWHKARADSIARPGAFSKIEGSQFSATQALLSSRSPWKIERRQPPHKTAFPGTSLYRYAIHVIHAREGKIREKRSARAGWREKRGAEGNWISGEIWRTVMGLRAEGRENSSISY